MPLKSKMTLVLGAGASVPYGYPIGSELIERIHSSATNNLGGFLEAGFDEDLVKHFAEAIINSGCNSIDDLLSHHQNLREVGRYAIAYNLYSCEDKNKLMWNSDEGHWYKYFFESKINATKIEDVVSNLKNLSVVTFNYDRSFKEFVWNRLRYGKNLQPADANEVIRHLNIIHVHGTLCGHTWDLGRDDKMVASNYGQGMNPAAMLEMSKTIKIIDDSDEIIDTHCKSARRAIWDATRVFFLGFGYHLSNMERIDMAPEHFALLQREKPFVKIEGTCLYMNSVELKAIQSQYAGFQGKALDIHSFLRESELFLIEK